MSPRLSWVIGCSRNASPPRAHHTPWRAQTPFVAALLWPPNLEFGKDQTVRNVLGRDASRLALAPFQLRHYRAAVNIIRTFPQPLTTLARYLTNRGTYPWTIELRTPIGRCPVTMYSSHDLLTVNEIFARQDYGDGDGVVVVVDFGANIGISALYFLTRRTTSRVHCFEPDPRNADRLRQNLTGFEDRYVLSEAAVAVVGGRATFMREETGRYGHLIQAGDRPNTTPLEVEVMAAVAVLDEVIDQEGHIDLLKIDTEGNEDAIVAAIPHGTMARIGHVYFENNLGRGGTFHLENTIN
jgi:FkbM family methyltransferase